MPKHTFYEVLEVSPTASEEIIKSAYKALSKKYHPDVYQGDPEFAHERMAIINEAYETLCDPIRRKEYDSSLLNVDEEVITDIQFSDNGTTDSYKPTKGKTQGHTGCLSNIIGVIFWVVVIFIIVRSCSSSKNATENETNYPSVTQTQTSGIYEDAQEAWMQTPIVSGNNIVLCANLPQNLISNMIVEANGSMAEYSSDNWGVTLVAQITEMEDEFPVDYDWTQTQVDSKYSGTAGDFLFEVAHNEFYEHYIVPNFLELNVDPECEASIEEINGTEWSRVSYSGSSSETGRIDLTITLYFHVDNNAAISFIVTSAYSISDIAQEDYQAMNEWIGNISSSLTLRSRESYLAEHSDQKSISNASSGNNDSSTSVINSYLGSWSASYYDNTIYIELWENDGLYGIYIDASTPTRVLTASTFFSEIDNVAGVAYGLANDEYWYLEATIYYSNGELILDGWMKDKILGYELEFSQLECFPQN